MFHWTRGMHLWQPCRKVCQRPKIHLSKPEKNYNFFTKILNMLLWTHRKQFWQPCRKLFAESPISSRPKSGKNPKFISSEKFLRKRRMPFWQPCRKYFTQSPKKSIILWNFKIFPKCFAGHAENSYDKSAENFPLFFFQFFPQNVPVDT